MTTMNRRSFAAVAAGLLGGLVTIKGNAQAAPQQVDKPTTSSPKRPYSLVTYYSEDDFLLSSNNMFEAGCELHSFSKQGSLIHAVYQSKK